MSAGQCISCAAAGWVTAAHSWPNSACTCATSRLVVLSVRLVTGFRTCLDSTMVTAVASFTLAQPTCGAAALAPVADPAARAGAAGADDAAGAGDATEAHPASAATSSPA